LDLLYKAGFDPEGLPTFFDRLKELEKQHGSVPTFVSTHPASDDRAKTLRQMIKKRGKAKIVALKVSWKEVKSSPCNPIRFTLPDKDVGEVPPLGPGGPNQPPTKGPGVDPNQPPTGPGRQPGLPKPNTPPNQPPSDPHTGEGGGGS
ncbi:MAG: hypothetical protein KC609_21335, partial [Myxococcales bacterium]|nr:hypothetical protein [Myxococcales bacterium]